MAACTGEDGTPSGVTPDLLGYDREDVERLVPAQAYEQRINTMTARIEEQAQRLGNLSAAVAELRDAGEMRGRSIANLKKTQLAAESQRADNRRALDAEIVALRSAIGEMQTRLEAMSEAIDGAASAASEAQVTANRSTAARMADSGDPVAGTVASGQSYGVHLASYQAEAAARNGWRELQDRYADVLSGLDMRLKMLELASLGDQYMRLVAGPFSSVAAAQTACQRLRAQDQFCQVTVYDGGEPDSQGD